METGQPPQLISFITFVSNFKNFRPAKTPTQKNTHAQSPVQIERVVDHGSSKWTAIDVCVCGVCTCKKPHKYIKMRIRPELGTTLLKMAKLIH